ncbi:hypothetical protein OsI_33265 [Oryza sativa Indica Group]|uniref:inositol-3-phosphate synthase n=1 Tax=Oryza sativa subsp. indica TaxID=39946 RepID=A2Z6I2_ORYSI|nr:hypothetical protein OsI_33265 [Oryza sativa Indica Group]
MFVEGFRVESPRVRYGDGEIESEYRYDTTEVVAPPSPEKGWVVRPKSVTYHFKTTTTVPKLGVMLVGWGGNNGTTLTAGVIANREEFKEKSKVDKVVVLWTANTERYSNVVAGMNDTMDNLLASLDKDEPEMSPSTLYAIACVMEGVPFINGSPQNTFVPGLIELAIKKNSVIGGDDFKSGQTKMKSVLVDFLVGAGIKPTSIASYNHLGNNDGMNLSAPQTFRSKEISKSGVVDDMVSSNAILYEPGEHPDHVIVIKG